MFKKLVNEAIITFCLSVNGPLLINNPAGSKIDPTLPDMSFVRCNHNGLQTVYLPGSSIKGVFRSRYEQLMKATKGGRSCNILSSKDSPEATLSCSYKLKRRKDKNEEERGKERYQKSCFACRLFGNLSLGSRVTFIDAYPSNGIEPKLGARHGVGIDRVTGAAASKALFDIEIVESGSFDFEIRLQNFELYQLYFLLWIIRDIDEGKVTFGMGGSRGNGQMRLLDPEKVGMNYRVFTHDDVTSLRGCHKEDLGSPVAYTEQILYKELVLNGLDDILKAINISSKEDLTKAMGREYL